MRYCAPRRGDHPLAPSPPLPKPPEDAVTESGLLPPSACWGRPSTRPGELCRDRPAAMTVTQTKSTGKTGKLTVGRGQKDAPSAGGQGRGEVGRGHLPHTHHPGAGALPTMIYEVSTVFVSSWKATYLGMGALIVESRVWEPILGEWSKNLTASPAQNSHCGESRPQLHQKGP